MIEIAPANLTPGFKPRQQQLYPLRASDGHDTPAYIYTPVKMILQHREHAYRVCYQTYGAHIVVPSND